MNAMAEAILRVWQSFNDWCERYLEAHNPDQ
jgi:hypothetical protein